MHKILTVARKVKNPSDRSISDNKDRTVVSDTDCGFDLVPRCRQLLIDKKAFFARTGLETPCINIKLKEFRVRPCHRIFRLRNSRSAAGTMNYMSYLLLSRR